MFPLNPRFAVILLTVGSAAAVTVQAQSPAALPRFEAASIRPLTPDQAGAIDFRFYPNRFVATTLRLSQLIEQAYSIEARELIGGPDWVRVDVFNVTATTGADVSQDRMKLMLQALLADRFQLQLEPETRTGTVYRLTARDVHDLNPPANPDAQPLISTIRKDGNGFLSYEFVGRNATMGTLALTLSRQLRAPVSDETKLTGSHDFRIAWAYDEPVGGLPPDPNVATIFTALDNQLGLKLVADEGPIRVFTIRRVSRPTPN